MQLDNFKVQKDKLYLILFFVICFVFYNFLPFPGSDYNIYSFLFSIFFFLCYHKRFKIKKQFSPIVILTVSSIFCCLITGKKIAISEFFLLFTFINVLLIHKRHYKVIGKSVKLLLVFYLIMLIFELIFPDLYYLKKILFKSSSFNQFSLQGRGFYALDTEPSFFVLNLFSLWLILFSINYFRPINVFYNILLLLLLVSSLSVMSVIVIPIILFFSLKKKYFFTLLIILPFLLNNFLLETRIYNTLKGVFNYEFIKLIESDSSFSSRLYYILKDLYIAFNSYLMPTGPGTYKLIQELHLSSIKNLFHLTKYDPFLPGSFLGYFIVQYGIFSLIILIVLYFKLSKYIGKFKSFCLILSLIVVLFQQISLMFVPIIFSLAIFYQQLQRQKLILS